MNGLDAECRERLSEAAQWRLLALLFDYPGDGWRRDVAALMVEVAHADLRKAAEGAQDVASDGLYLALFGPGGPVSLREATYLGGVQLGYLMSELSAQYEAFGYTPHTPESLDHVSVELDFLAYLKIKEAYALSCGDREHAAISSDAAANFMKEHLARVAEPVAKALENLAPEYLVHAGRFLLNQIGPCPRSSWPLGDLLGGLEHDEMSCSASESQEELVRLPGSEPESRPASPILSS
jgi:nitrate reductase assembly molybdenum cofactor insertion protein NarJ